MRSLPLFILSAGVLVLAAVGPGKAQTTTISSWITTKEGLSEALESAPSGPVCVGSGRGFNCGALRLRMACMTPTNRVGWYDKHTDGACVEVLVVEETTRAESGARDEDEGE